MMAMMTDVPMGQMLPFGLIAGIGFGAFFGVFVAFLYKGTSVTISVSDKVAFIARLNVAAAQLGYHPETNTGEFLTYKPSFQAGLMAGRISALVGDDSAVIVGPKTYVTRLIAKAQ